MNTIAPISTSSPVPGTRRDRGSLTTGCHDLTHNTTSTLTTGQAIPAYKADGLAANNPKQGSSLNCIGNEKLNRTVSCFEPDVDDPRWPKSTEWPSPEFVDDSDTTKIGRPMKDTITYTQLGAEMIINSLERTIKTKDEIIALQANRITTLQRLVDILSAGVKP